MEVRTRLPWKIVLITATIVSIVLLGVAGLGWQAHHSALKDPFSTSIRSAAHTQLYYPTKLPRGYVLNPGSISQPEKGVTIISFKDEKSHTLHMTQQALPAGFNIALFNKNFEHPTAFNTAAGQAIIGAIKDKERTQHIASVTGNNPGGTWILISTTSDVPFAVLREVAEQLTKSK